MASSFSISQICVMSLLLTGATDSTARAEDVAAANVFIEFSGGAVDRDMAQVIKAFAGKVEIMPVRKYLPAQTSGLCPILNSQLGLTEKLCTGEIIDAIRALNERHGVALDPGAVDAVQGVVLPEIQLTTSEVSRIYNLDQQTEAQRLEQIEKNPSWQTSILRKETDLLARNDKGDMTLPQLEQLTFKRIAWEFTIKGSEDRIAEAQYLSQVLVNRNLSVDVESIYGFDKKAHSATRYTAPDHFRKWCVDRTAPNTAEGKFSDLTGWLYETKDVVTCEDQDPPRPEVVIMDQAIAPNSDLAASFPDVTRNVAQPPAACETDSYARTKDHGTLLSTIVASNANSYGFLGMEPKATIRSFVWGAAETDKDLKDFIRDVTKPVQPQVFLFASEFQPYPPYPKPEEATESKIRAALAYWQRKADETWLDLLANEEVRVRGGLARAILQSKMLLVVAAGQSPDGNRGREIYEETPMPPQNLGDYDQVLVVGACERCDTDAKLWARSNRGGDSKAFVAVMAPGAEKIPTYLSNHKVAETEGGTSASAAFVAGLAAKMASCYPSSYNAQPANLKERVILASRPISDKAANDHIAGGVIDPEVSMLDPKRDWLKLKDRPVRAVEFVSWCGDRLKLGDEARDPLNLPRTRRISNVDGVGLVQQRVNDIVTDPVYDKRQVQRELPATPLDPDSRVALVRYDASTPECAVNIPRLTDLFLSKTYKANGDCSAAPLCE
jgi:hypothetical protein